MTYYLDTRHIGRDGRCPIRIRVAKDGKYAMVLTGIKAAPSEWKDGRPKDARLSLRLRDLLDNAEDCVLRLKASGRYASMTVKEICDELARKVLISDKPVKRDLFLTHLETYRDRQRKAGTKEVYERTARKLREFDPDIASRKFRDIDIQYLGRFEDHCTGGGMRLNSISVLMRCIRSVFNDAKEEGLTTFYPFNRYHIRQEPTRKRCLSVGELERLATLEIPESQERYRDYFLLMLYLIGINSTDLFHAKPEDLHGGRLWYVRDKTGKPYSVKVEPEALAIIERHRGKEWLLEPLDSHSDFIAWRNQLNKRLKALGQVTGRKGKVIKPGPFPELSTYWARHTWATVAYQIGIPVDIIGQALGHSDRSHAVTHIYIKPSARKVDEANRKVLDYLMQNAPALRGTGAITNATL